MDKKSEDILESLLKYKLLGLKNETEEQTEVFEKHFNKTNEFLLLITEIELKHIDVLLEGLKNFLVIFSTAFIAALTIDIAKITNLDVNLVRIISFLCVVALSVGIILTLNTRNKIKRRILKAIEGVDKAYADLVEIKLESIKSLRDENIQKIRKEVVSKIESIERIRKTK